MPLSIICNLSVKQGAFPNRWKDANVVPVLKKSVRKLPGNYRAVSFLLLFGKTLERLSVIAFFSTLNPSYQTRGTAVYLTDVVILTWHACLRSAWRWISHGSQTDVFMDFTAAFQNVIHGLLLYKL